MNLLAKFSFFGSAGSMAWLSTIVNIPDRPLIQNKKLSDENLPKTIGSIDDIEVYEKKYGCKYQFVHKWGTKEVYGAREFLKHQRKEDDWQRGWARVLFTKADETKAKCRNKEKMIFVWDNYYKKLQPKVNLN